jgi:DNA-directed RNA polymerase specialized sigma subunit
MDIEHFDEEFPAVKQEKIDFKSKDLHLYNQWRSAPTKKNMTILVDHLSPLIYKEVSRAAGTLPIAALNAEGKNWAIKAIHTYDPDRGFALGTHVTNYLQRVRRMNYKYQHVAKLPENMKMEFPLYNNAMAHLTEQHNREPTEDELASALGWSKGKVVKFKERIHADLIDTGEDNTEEIDRFSDENLLMHHILSQLTPEERIILNNKGKISATDLAVKLGVNGNRLNYLQNKLITKIKNLKMEHNL